MPQLIDNIINLRLHQLRTPQKHGLTIANRGTLARGSLKYTSIGERMSAKGKFSAEDLHACVEDSHSTVDEEVVYARYYGGIIGCLHVVDVEKDGIGSLGGWREGWTAEGVGTAAVLGAFAHCGVWEEEKTGL